MATLSRPGRVLDASTGFTKLDLARYFAEIAPWLLPHVKGRHTYVKRAPDGIEARMIFQQHPANQPTLPPTDAALWPGHEPAIAIETAEDLLAIANLAGIELHTWNSTAKAILQPDWLIFDLDPGEGVTWAQVREAALLVRALLQELGLKSWLKTTGGKGLHVVVPIRPEHGYETAKAFTRAVVLHLAAAIPQRFVAKSGPSNRKGRIFIDFLRNGQSQSTVAGFSPRARPGMGVSMPIDWDELPDVQRADQWTIATAPARMEALGVDPWKGLWRSRQALGPAMRKLGFEPPSA